MKLIKNWSKMWASLAVILPTLATLLIVIADYLLQANLVPIAYVPLVVMVTGFIGRIIKQKGLGNESR